MKALDFSGADPKDGRDSVAETMPLWAPVAGPDAYKKQDNESQARSADDTGRRRAEPGDGPDQGSAPSADLSSKAHPLPDETKEQGAATGNGPEAIGPDAFHGVAGDLVHAVEARTEVDSVAILGTILAIFGALAGHCRTFYQGSPQTANLYVALVGDSSTSRKGTALSLVRDMFGAAHPEWKNILVPGLASGEGLIGHLKRLEGREHRALVLETELGRLLRVMDRQGSTLSPTLRDAWDGGPIGRFLAREGALVSWHHVGCLAHVTRVELREKLADVDAANGFGNRFLWLHVQRRRLVPFPKPPGPLIAPYVQALHDAIAEAQVPGEMAFTPDARDYWEDFYAREASRARFGLSGALTARSEAQAARLALVYALLDRSPAIDVVHLLAAVAVVDYAERSVRFIFGDSVGNPLADLIRRDLAEGEATRMELRQKMGIHDAVRLQTALDLLTGLGLVTMTKGEAGPQGGRRPEVYRLVPR